MLAKVFHYMVASAKRNSLKNKLLCMLVKHSGMRGGGGTLIRNLVTNKKAMYICRQSYFIPSWLSLWLCDRWVEDTVAKLYVSRLLRHIRAMAARITMIVMRIARAKPPTDAETTVTTNALLLFPSVRVGSAKQIRDH